MKYLKIGLVLLVLLTGCVDKDPEMTEEEKIEQLYQSIETAIIDKNYEEALDLIQDVKDEDRAVIFFENVIDEYAMVDTAEGLVDDLASYPFKLTQVRDELIRKLDDALDENQSYVDLLTTDQQAYVAILAATSYDILREDAINIQTAPYFISTFTNEMNGKTEYDGYDFDEATTTLALEDAQKIMKDAFNLEGFNEFEFIGDRVDCGWYGIGGPVGKAEFISIDIQPTRWVLSFRFIRYDYDGSIYATTLFNLTTNQNPESMFGLTIQDFQLIE